MAVRIRSRFHAGGQSRSMATLASVVAVLSWKLAIDALNRMRQADYDIDIGRPYLDFVSEFTVFLALLADRIAYRDLDADQRIEFTTALVKRLSSLVEENFGTYLEDVVPGEMSNHVLELFNRRSVDYAEFNYTQDGPDFGFKRCFAACLREGLPEKDKLWVVDQVMDIEVPEAMKALNKTLAGLFHPEVNESRHRKDGSATGE